ncbi:hypothetical protein [Azospirillum brasilense]|uniref:hypothetical protein n=1 Tax=Azospirillum brasilense TaxID=192 RepID=UPI0013B43594|nr:hypothetical protein [Azospirillum brasilense]
MTTNVLKSKRVILLGFVVVAGIVDQIAGTDLLPPLFAKVGPTLSGGFVLAAAARSEPKMRVNCCCFHPTGNSALSHVTPSRITRAGFPAAEQ